MTNPTAADPAIIVEHRGAVTLIRLNEPRSMNALSPTIKAALLAELPAIIHDPRIRAIVIIGTGRAFCAGGDIRAMDDRQTVPMRRRMQSNYRWLIPLLQTDKPVITAINGTAAGAGFSLAMAGDIVIGSRTARFKAGFAGLGAVPDLALAWLLPRAVGLQRAKTILLENRDVGAEEALSMGLLTRISEPESLLDDAMATAESLAAGPTVSFGMTKQLLSRAYDQPIESFLELEGMAQTMAFGSADFAEGVAAFRAKRPPVFNGE